MANFKLTKLNNASVNRSVRFGKNTLEKLELISKATGVSVNKIINKCVDFALENMANK